MAADAPALLAALPQLAFDAALVVARVGSAVMLLPVLGEAEVPAVVRAGFVVVMTAVLLPVLAPGLPALPSQPLTLAAMVGAEVVTGLWFGWLARLLMLALTTAGQITALLVGQSSVLQQDPALGASSAALGRLMSVAAPVVLLTGGLYALPLQALAGSYTVITPGALLPAADTALGVASAVASMFALALRLAAPFLLASFGWHLSVGLLGRVVPQMQAHLQGLAGAAQLLLGLVLLALLAASLLAVWQGRAADVLAALPGS